LAIAVNTTMFSVLDAMINPNIGASHPEQLYTIRFFGRFYGPNRNQIGRSTPEMVLGAGGRTYSAYTAARGYMRGSIVERGGADYPAQVIIVRENFFATMGIAPMEGTLSPPPDASAAAASVIISDRFRTRLFADGEPVVGRTLDLDGQTVTIIGVAKHYDASETLNRDIWTFPPVGMELSTGYVRLRAGVTARAAEREFDLLASRLALAEGEKTSDARFDLKPFTGQFEVQRFHWALIGAGIAVLLVACTNLANLQLARGLGRAGELAVRSALGATRGQIVAQLLIESAVLAAGALVLALLLALAGNAAIHATIPANVGQYVIEPQASWRMVAFASVAAVLALALVGFVPAISVSRVDLNTLLKSRAGTGAHRRNQRTYGGLVITQIALTLPLVCAAVLLSRSALQQASPEYRKAEHFGFDSRNLVSASILLPPSPDAKIPIAEVASSLESDARNIAGVADAAAWFNHGVVSDAVSVDDNDGSVREFPTPGKTYEVVSPSYFRTMGLPIERGRDFSEGAHDAPEIVIDRYTGWYLWPRSAPLGRSIKMGSAHSDAPWIKVVGVVGDSLSDDARQIARVMDTLHVSRVYRVLTLTDSAPASKYPTFVELFVRARSDPQRVATTLRHKLRGRTTLRPPTVALFDVTQGIPQRVAVLRFIAGLFTTFGVLALGLSSLGVYGIVAQSAADRRREVAMRVALGATPGHIVRALIREGNVLVLAGVAIGLYMTKETIGWLGSFLGEVDTANALLFGALCIAMFGAMVLSALVPAFRATKLDPMEVLRAE
ncbi:MAG: FtsX-like permease family protein, partial [bacterium]